MTNKRLLIVGGEGFIGKHLSERAIKAGYKVTVISRRGTKSTNHEYELLVCDICNKTELDNKLKDREFEYVINCSGYIKHTPFFQGGRELIEQHFNGLLNIVECVNSKVLRAFVQLGSSDEYGSNEAPQIEDQREGPISCYSTAKMSSSHFLQMLHKNENFPAIIFRLFLVYGPGQSLERFIPQTIDACLKDTALPVSEGIQLRDFCYIDDIVSGIIKSLDITDIQGQIINLASGIPVSIKDMIDKIQSITGGGKPIYGEVPYRAGENMALYANTDKAKNLLGWSPSISLEDGLSRTIDYYKNIY